LIDLDTSPSLNKRLWLVAVAADLCKVAASYSCYTLANCLENGKMRIITVDTSNHSHKPSVRLQQKQWQRPKLQQQQQ